MEAAILRARVTIQQFSLGSFIGNIGSDNPFELIADVLHELPPDGTVVQIEMGRLNQWRRMLPL